ncbi:unnamed protein product [Eruca vesicaria subsp. sativa]|uniref:F-box domain-containing protein n=1 Tax=Eruca vesicaria subsp. sativa TaxID=29727 RepID=A0ABC8IN52_ERUVS|nr:unnamed protein product [Eruca vesicaria subsp. sativa]
MASPRRPWSLSLLPPEIIHEIFYKTPAEALVRSKPTCKKLYTLITDETFIHKHFQRSQEHFLRATDTVQIMDPSTRKNSVLPVPNELLQHPFKIDTLVDTHMVHCDGFMLVEYKDDGSRDTNLALWNPVLRNIRWIEPSRSITSFDYHGIGYDKNKNGYKILRFTSRPWEIERYEDEPKVEIYECNTSSWRTLDLELDMNVNIMRNCVAVMGNMYWIVYRDDEEEEEDEEEFIRCFDFSDETFKDICFCPPSYDNSHLSSFNGDSLSLLQQEQVSRTIEVWVSSKLGDGDVSFSKYFSLSAPDLPALRLHDDAAYAVYCFAKTKSVIAWCVGVEGEGDKVCRCLTLYEIDEDGVRNEKVTERDYMHDYSGSFVCGYVYVPSMIPLPWVRD